MLNRIQNWPRAIRIHCEIQTFLRNFESYNDELRTSLILNKQTCWSEQTTTWFAFRFQSNRSTINIQAPSWSGKTELTSTRIHFSILMCGREARPNLPIALLFYLRQSQQQTLRNCSIPSLTANSFINESFPIQNKPAVWIWQGSHGIS